MTTRTLCTWTLVIATCLLAGCRIPYTKFPELAGSGREQVPAERCRECHTVIYDEWSESLHSRAFTNPLFKQLTNDYRVTACLKCHAPVSAFDPEPRLREVFREEGVPCQSCHLIDGKLQGPVAQHLPFDIHPIQEKNPLYRKSDLCGACHQTTFAEYKKSGKTDKTCQTCHMPEVVRTIIDNRPWVWTKKKHPFRRHTFDIQDVKNIGDKIAMDLRIDGREPPHGRVAITNKAIPHNIPTGGYGYHVLQLTVRLLDDLGETVEKKTFYFTQELKTAIAPGKTATIDFTLEDEGQLPWAVKATLTKSDLNHPGRDRVLAEEVKLLP